MDNRKVRIGIDVGGTFTDAVVVDNETYEVIAKEKVPTTHHAERGVAQGIIEAINTVLTKNGISPDNVIFIAHGTTQATNALLEGDVARVGIVGMGSGMEAERSRKETTVGNIELAPGKYLYTEHEFIDAASLTDEAVKEAIDALKLKNVEVIVASESYSVDNPENEQKVIDLAVKEGLVATGGHEMSIDEVRKRPILTMLSGLAAGVAGALMYEKLTDGIFLEAGGTSTDISAIKDGKVMIKNAQIGGRKLYLTSLDVRTLGIAGGSMIVVRGGKIADVGPRSAHIAEKEYEVFTDTDKMKNPKIELIAPREDDTSDYAVVACANGESYALTLAGAANILGYVPADDYAAGNVESAKIAWGALASMTGSTVEELCRQAMDIAMTKVGEIVKQLIADYNLNPNLICLVGGGGSASVVVPYLGEKMGIRHKIAENAPYISTIGVSLALVREQMERNVANPTDEDIRKIRHDIMEVITRAGADAATVDISIEIDSQKNILRAIATGATELRTKDRNAKTISEEEQKQILADAEKTTTDMVEQAAAAGRWHAYYVNVAKGGFLGLFKSKKKLVRMIDEEGVIRLQKNIAKIGVFHKDQIGTDFMEFVDGMTQYTDAGATLPKTYLFFGQKMSDLSGVLNKEQLLGLAEMELEFVEDDQEIIAVAAKD